MLKSINNLAYIFHLAIIASLVLGISGCGYKAAPFYSEEAPVADENVKFIIQNKKIDNNESCK